MPLESLYLDNFRLFKNKKLTFKKNHTFIFGNNGSGKTSLLEAINLVYTNKSIRTVDLAECIKEGEQAFKIGVSGRNREHDFTRTLTKEKGKKLENKINTRNVNKAEMELPILLLNKQLRLIDGDPETRREFFNNLMFHVKHETKNISSNYFKVLSQRNRAIKKGAGKKEISIWTDKLVDFGEKLNVYQKEVFLLYKKSIAKEVIPKRKLDFYKGLNLKFKKGWAGTKSFGELLTDNFEKDRVLGYTQFGPHKFDFNFYTYTKKSKNTLSRGQQKLLILLTFLSINDFFKSINRPGALLLIDDLSSELDKENLKLFLNEVPKHENQIFITDIDSSNSLKKDLNDDTFERIII